MGTHWLSGPQIAAMKGCIEELDLNPVPLLLHLRVECGTEKPKEGKFFRCRKKDGTVLYIGEKR